ncbi:MAG TPA: Rne/Rng family ribonuclease, partial [Bryobacteraceae bacterium]|nr:Rne/Rng family ribonuclease [Bryobacteraceae bacterium]
LDVEAVLSPAAAPLAADEVNRTDAGVDRNGGDRKGRRSRRRRNRGRGFPDSKYASDVPAGDDDSSAGLSAPDDETSESAAGNSEVILLPGESLAKYSSRPLIESLTISSLGSEAADDPELTAADVFDSGQAPDGVEELPSLLQTMLPESDPEQAEEELQAEESENAEALNEQRLEAGQLPSEPVDHAFFDSPITSPGPQLERAAFVPLSEAEEEEIRSVVEEVESASQVDDDLDLALSDTPDVGSAETLSLETPDEITESLDDLEPMGDDESSARILDEEAPALTGTATADAAPDSLSASVREQGSRYPHRGSRRMRRGRRGPEGPNPAAGAAPVAEHGAPEQRFGGGRDRHERPERTERAERPERPERADKVDRADRPALPSITDLLREGQESIVQSAKEPLGQKGARITSHIALPGRYVVYMPTLEHLGVSRKIASDEERQRLKRILQGQRAGLSGGFIVRTAGEGHSEDEIASDMAYLYNLWLDIRQKAEKKPAPLLLHHDLDIVQRILRDQLSDMFKTIWVDNEDIYESILRFMQRFQPSLVGRVKLYTRATPIFDGFNVTQEIEKALRPKVWLKSGGYIVVNQTEALVAIDVNTGKYVGKSNRLEDTITKTNTEAVKEIVRQIRLRDLGGIIVVDFIDMDERKNRQKVMQTLEEAMRADRAPYKILQFNDFGLVAITRKRVKQSLERTLCAPCPTCEGASYVKSVMTVVGEILQEANKLRSVVEGKNVLLRTHPEVAKYLKSSRNTYLEEIEEVLGKPVLVTSDPLLHPEKFNLAW